MSDPDRAHRRRIAIATTAASVVMALGGSHAVAAETCAWTRTPSGADFGTCAEPSGKTYCVTCQYAPRVCVRSPC